MKRLIYCLAFIACAIASVAMAKMMVDPNNTDAGIDTTDECLSKYPIFPRRGSFPDFGLSIVKISIDADGRVVGAQLVKSSSSKELDKKALLRISTCKFTPALVNGKPQKSTTDVFYRWGQRFSSPTPFDEQVNQVAIKDPAWFNKSLLNPIPNDVPIYFHEDSCGPVAYSRTVFGGRNEEETTVRFFIGVDGQITGGQVVASSGSKDLDRAVLIGLSHCNFEPAVIEGKLTPSWIFITYVWQLRPSELFFGGDTHGPVLQEPTWLQESMLIPSADNPKLVKSDAIRVYRIKRPHMVT